MEQVLQSTLGSAQISELIFGTMRLTKQSPSANLDLLRYLYQHGINTHHISAEYDSYEAYVALHTLLRNENIQINHVVKIAAPDFKQETFNPSLFEERIDRELLNLGIDQLTLVQWMFRMEQLNDAHRISITTLQADMIAETFAMLKQKGKVAEFGHFPYTNEYAAHVSNVGLTSIIINYLNIYEYENVTLGQHNSFIALRPFAAGKIKEVLANEQTLQDLQVACALNRDQMIAAVTMFPFLYPEVKAVVCSLGNANQVDTALRCYHEIKKMQSNCAQIANTIIKMTNFVT